MAFLQHAPQKSSASRMECFPRSSREITRIVVGQNVGNTHVKTSDPERLELYFSLNTHIPCFKPASLKTAEMLSIAAGILIACGSKKESFRRFGSRKRGSGRPNFIQGWYCRTCALSMRVPNPNPVLDITSAPLGPENLSSTGAQVWRKAPGAFPDSSSVLDTFQSAKGLVSCQGGEGSLSSQCNRALLEET